MELLQLRYFFDSANFESFAKTAEKYTVPASSVSASIKRLETELGCPLFDRSANRVVLNSNGRRLRQSLELIFKELDRTVGNLSAVVDDHRQIKLLVKAFRNVVTDCIIEYKEQHVNTRFQMVFDFDEKNFENYDIIVDVRKDCYAAYASLELCKNRVQICAAANSPLAGKKLVLKQLADQPFVTMSHQGDQHKRLLSACQKNGFTPHFVAQVNDYTCFQKIIESGMAIGLAGDRSFAGRPDTKITFLDISDFTEHQNICVYYKQEAAYGSVKQFLDFLKSKALLLHK